MPGWFAQGIPCSGGITLPEESWGSGGSPASHSVLASFRRRYGDDSTLTTSYLDGLHAFFYGAPNSLPNVLFPLFSRVEDYSIYPTEHFIGVPRDTVCWTMDDGEE